MTAMSIDQRLSDRLHAMVDHEPGSPAPTQVLLERGRRARRRRTATLAGVTVAAVAAVAAAATGVVALQQPAPPGRIVTAPGGTPELRLAAAVAASGSTSYTFTIKMVATVTRTAKGEYDPAATTGVLHYGDGGEQRLVGGERFIGDGKGHWKKQNDGRHDTLTFSGLGDDQFTVSGDPAQLLQNLAKAGTVTEASPGVYRFTIPHPTDAALVTSGEAMVADGRVKKVVYTTPFFENGPDRQSVAAVTVEFAGYGKKVTVRRPAHWVD